MKIEIKIERRENAIEARAVLYGPNFPDRRALARAALDAQLRADRFHVMLAALGRERSEADQILARCREIAKVIPVGLYTVESTGIGLAQEMASRATFTLAKWDRRMSQIFRHSLPIWEE